MHYPPQSGGNEDAEKYSKEKDAENNVLVRHAKIQHIRKIGLDQTAFLEIVTVDDWSGFGRKVATGLKESFNIFANEISF